MKRLICLIFALMPLLVSCGNGGGSVVGKWIDTQTEAVYEYTSDGFYYEYVNEGFTADKTRYKTDGKKITYYIDGESEKNGFSVDYEISDEGNLIINGEIEYKPLLVPENK